MNIALLQQTQLIFNILSFVHVVWWADIKNFGVYVHDWDCPETFSSSFPVYVLIWYEGYTGLIN